MSRVTPARLRLLPANRIGGTLHGYGQGARPHGSTGEETVFDIARLWPMRIS
jgi:hypothetical protein